MNLRRGETRADVSFEVDVNRMVIKDNFPVVLPELFTMTVINLSVNGIMFYCEADFPDREYFSTVLSINHTNIYIACQCVRKIHLEDGFGYGCSLLGLSKSEQQMIRQYVYTQQMQERSMAREKYSRYLKKMMKYTSEQY